MKTISIEDDVYKKLLDAKHSLNVRSYSEVLRKVFSEDRVNWVFKFSGKIKLDETAISKVDSSWKKWNIQ